jgi:hypothetical protein
VNAFLRRQIELVAGLHAERLVPRVEIANDAVDPIPLGTVRIGQ